MMYFMCNLCERSFPSSYSDLVTLKNFLIHLSGESHSSLVKEEKENSGSIRNETLFCNLCEETVWLNTISAIKTICSLSDHIDSYSHKKNLLDHLKSVSSYSSDTEEIGGLFFDCHQCECIVNISRDVFSTEKTLWIHISGKRHQENKEYGPNRMTCNVCNCVITLSNDDENTIHNINQHLKGQRHQSKVN